MEEVGLFDVRSEIWAGVDKTDEVEAGLWCPGNKHVVEDGGDDGVESLGCSADSCQSCVPGYMYSTRHEIKPGSIVIPAEIVGGTVAAKQSEDGGEELAGELFQSCMRHGRSGAKGVGGEGPFPCCVGRRSRNLGN